MKPRQGSEKIPAYALLLRGINLGRRRVKMAALEEMLTELGYASVSSLLASGNLVFQSRRRSQESLEQEIESHLATRLGYSVDSFVRSDAQLQAVAMHRPFGSLEDSEEFTMHVLFFKRPVEPVVASTLTQAQTLEDRIEIEGREVYWLRQGRLSDSTYWENPSVKSLKLPTTTMRTAATIRKLAQKFS